ncbi:HNH nuclease [Candidatus Nanopelagicaceae bacterium]
MLVHILILTPLRTVINPHFYARSAILPKILFPRCFKLCETLNSLSVRSTTIPSMTTARLIDVDELSQRVAELLHAIPGAATMARLSEIDPWTLSAVDRINYLAALDRQDGWLYALRQRAIAAVAGLQPSEGDGPLYGVDEAEREDISTALRLAPATAQSRIDIARTLVNNLPNTCSALATGEISAAHATVIARETATAIRNGAPESVIFDVEQRALSFAELHTPGQLTARIRTDIAKSIPEEFEEVTSRAASHRRVSCYNEADGMSTVIAILPAADAQIVMNSIESFILRQEQLEHSRIGNELESAKSNNDGSEVSRTIDQKRADALSAICSNFLSEISETVIPQRRPLTVNVTIDLPTLLGLAENPGQLAGYGPIPASVARELASDAKWKKFITEPQTGNLLDFGRESYEPPRHLKDFLIARDRTCRFPGCRRSALLSDLDHAESWESGGTTSPDNLGALCRRHHRLKTHDGWKIESFSDGSCTWTSPLGKSFFTPARSINEPT